MRLILFFILCLGACFSYRVYQRYLRNDLVITVFDVGQGDSILVEFPQGKTLLIDAGGGNSKWNWGQKELFGELTRKGILHLDAALMTHPDADHSYGFRGLLSELPVTEFWLNSSFLESPKPIVKDLVLSAELKGGKARPFGAVQEFVWNGVGLRLIPLQVDHTTNNRTLVLKLQFGKCDLLFVGDIEKEAERFLAKSMGKIDILKVPHHGSHTSSSPLFLESIQPQLALISDGVANRYGHPHRDVLARYRRKGIDILRTDFHGFIELTLTRDGRVTCDSARGNCGGFVCH